MKQKKKKNQKLEGGALEKSRDSRWLRERPMGGARAELSPPEAGGRGPREARYQRKPASAAGLARMASAGRSRAVSRQTLREVSPDLVTRPCPVWPQTSSPPPHGRAERAAAGCAAVGPCRGPELLRGLRAACGLVSKSFPDGPPRLRTHCEASSPARPQIPSLPRPPGSWCTSCRLTARLGISRGRV